MDSAPRIGRYEQGCAYLSYFTHRFSITCARYGAPHEPQCQPLVAPLWLRRLRWLRTLQRRGPAAMLPRTQTQRRLWEAEWTLR